MTVDILAALARIEERQAAYGVVALRILGCLQVQNEKLDAILAAAAPPTGPSPTQQALAELLAAVQAQTAAVEALPAALVEAMREDAEAEMDDEGMGTKGAERW